MSGIPTEEPAPALEATASPALTAEVSQAETPQAPVHRGTQRLVLRNAAMLVLAQLAGAPLSMLINAVMARYLGPQEFGILYLAWTYTGFAGLGADWGTSSAVPAMVATDRSRAGELLGSALVWRVAAWSVSYGVLAIGSFGLGYTNAFQIALALVVLNSATSTLVGAGQDIIRGFERTDVIAVTTVGGQLLTAVLVIPTLMLGGRVPSVLLAQTLMAAAIGVFVWPVLRKMKIGAVSFRLATLKSLLVAGVPFLFFGVAMALQPTVDAVFLSKLASPEAVGWYAAARKLVGVLIFPAGALITALYPTLCRLHTEDVESFRQTARSALRIVTVLAVPIAVGCALYPELGISIFSRQAFGPAANDLRILSIFVLLVYFTMTLGTCLLAAGKQRSWAIIQCLCVVVSAVLDPILVPWFQARMANGGLGTCVASVVSEVFMVIAGVWLTPRGVFDRMLLRGLFLAMVAGGAMALVARLLHHVTPFVAAPVAVVAYGVALVLTGGIDKEQLQMFKGIVGRKLARR